METCMKTLIEQSKTHAITYETFMTLALYDEQFGYYMKDQTKIGKKGDFFTSPTVHPVFGKVFAHLFVEVIQKEGLPPTICEIGAGTGHFAKAVMMELKDAFPLVYEKSNYMIVETSPFHQQQQRIQLREVKEHVRYVKHWEDLSKEQGSFEGIVFANEWLDAFPVHVVEKVNHDLFEIWVTEDEDKEKFVEIKKKCDNEDIFRWLNKYGIVLEEGQRFEIPLLTEQTLTKLYKWIKHGVFLTIDYGYTKDEWQHPLRRQGSLRGYYKHQLIKHPLQHPGEMDLTSHVHWDAWIQLAKEEGVHTFGLVRQHQFLLQAGIVNFLQETNTVSPFSDAFKQNRAIQSLISESGISASFDVLIQGKNVQKSHDYSFLKPFQWV